MFKGIEWAPSQLLEIVKIRSKDLNILIKIPRSYSRIQMEIKVRREHV
jgi:hypothetical protein